MMEDAVCDAEGAGNAWQIYPSRFLWWKKSKSTLARDMSNRSLKDQPTLTAPKSAVVHDLDAKAHKMSRSLTLRETKLRVGHRAVKKSPHEYEA